VQLQPAEKAGKRESRTRVQRRASARLKSAPELKVYEESKETHLDSSSAVNLCSTIIVAPQRGQCQTAASEACSPSGAAGVQER
jgi:hypothetical protein